MTLAILMPPHTWSQGPQTRPPMDINTDELRSTPPAVFHKMTLTTALATDVDGPSRRMALRRLVAASLGACATDLRAQTRGATPAATASEAIPGFPTATVPGIMNEVHLPEPQRLGPGLWCLPAHGGDADEVNRGFVANLLLARDSEGLWLIGSGPSPRFGRALEVAIRTRWPQQPLELASPWAHPETVLGVAGVPHRHHTSHAEVAQQMAQRCPGCLQRLAARMGSAAADLEIRPADTDSAAPHPIQIPVTVFRGDAGRWGPFDWHRRQRAADVTVIIFTHRSTGVVHAPGLLWGDVPPDGRDADSQALAASLSGLAQWGQERRVRRWLGQQGGVVGMKQVHAAALYWQGLAAKALEGQERGDDGLQAPMQIDGVPAHWLAHAHHTLNWQRSWRQAESHWLQRSLR